LLRFGFELIEYMASLYNCEIEIVDTTKKSEQEDYYLGHSVEVVDVCGAGDTFLSALVYEYLNTSDIPSAILFANKASSIAVQHSGVYTLSLDDIKSIKFDNT
jgi:D-beta-D-heptose 7-phosphate kinase/D-beta-D-heptose 1-phosphate adenosyltransferase